MPLIYRLHYSDLHRYMRRAMHAHPASPAVPGESDISGSRSNSLMLILACCDQKAGLWRIRGGAAHRAVLCIYRG